MDRMSDNEHRQVPRDSLFLMADMRVDGIDGEYRIRVRNLSPGGMMGEGAVRVTRGTMVDVSIRNVGWVRGSIAWVQDNRFGIAFSQDIDPKLARAPVGKAEDQVPGYVRNYQPHAPDRSNLRKV